MVRGCIEPLWNSHTRTKKVKIKNIPKIAVQKLPEKMRGKCYMAQFTFWWRGKEVRNRLLGLKNFWSFCTTPNMHAHHGGNRASLGVAVFLIREIRLLRTAKDWWFWTRLSPYFENLLDLKLNLDGLAGKEGRQMLTRCCWTWRAATRCRRTTHRWYL